MPVLPHRGLRSTRSEATEGSRGRFQSLHGEPCDFMLHRIASWNDDGTEYRESQSNLAFLALRLKSRLQNLEFATLSTVRVGRSLLREAGVTRVEFNFR